MKWRSVQPTTTTTFFLFFPLSAPLLSCLYFSNVKHSASRVFKNNQQKGSKRVGIVVAKVLGNSILWEMSHHKIVSWLCYYELPNIFYILKHLLRQVNILLSSLSTFYSLSFLLYSFIPFVMLLFKWKKSNVPGDFCEFRKGVLDCSCLYGMIHGLCKVLGIKAGLS